MWDDEGSDDEYLAALDEFEARQAPAAALGKQRQASDNRATVGGASNQPPAPLQQRNGAAAPPPPAPPQGCPPSCLGPAFAAAPLGAAGVRHLFRRPSAGGSGPAGPGAVTAATVVSAAPTPAAAVQPQPPVWQQQQGQQPPAAQQQQLGGSAHAGMLQQAAPWSARPPFPGTHQQQPTQQQQPGMVQQQPTQQQQHPPPQQQPWQQQWANPQPGSAAHLPPPPQRQQQQQQQQKQKRSNSVDASGPAQQAAAPAEGPPQQLAAAAVHAPAARAVEPGPAAAAAGGQPPAAADGLPASAAAEAPGAAAAAAEAQAGSTAAAEAGGAAAQPKRKLKQLFDFLLVYDLEATCDADKSKQPQPQEIIELSCVAVETATLRLLPSTFQRYVKPDQHPVLTQFCTELTGITQDMVDAGVPLREALAQHEAWLREQGILGKGRTCVPVTWRDWDLKVMMAMETKWRGIEQPKYLKRWVDLSAVVFKHSKARGNLRASVEAAGLQWEGRAHSAIDDARNTARLAIKLMLRGVILGITGSFSGVDASGRFKQATLQLGGGSASGSVKPSSGGGGAAGSGPASGAGTGRASGGTGGARSSGGGLGYGFGAQQQQPAKKKKIYDAEGAWNGCCFCGVRAKKRQVKRPGPNNGREFWSCGKFSMTGGGPTCEFFKFTSDIAAPPPAAKKQR